MVEKRALGLVGKNERARNMLVAAALRRTVDADSLKLKIGLLAIGACGVLPLPCLGSMLCLLFVTEIRTLPADMRTRRARLAERHKASTDVALLFDPNGSGAKTPVSISRDLG